MLRTYIKVMEYGFLKHTIALHLILCFLIIINVYYYTIYLLPIHLSNIEYLTVLIIIVFFP